MEEKLRQYLAKNKINYETHFHSPVFTVAESKKLRLRIEGVTETKNLFVKNPPLKWRACRVLEHPENQLRREGSRSLKDETPEFFLICMYAHKRLDLSGLKNKLKAKKHLTFATTEELRVHLKVSPGSVSIFSMINANEVTL